MHDKARQTFLALVAAAGEMLVTGLLVWQCVNLLDPSLSSPLRACVTPTPTFGCHLGASTASGGLYANALSTDMTRSLRCVCSQGSRRRRAAPQLKLLSSGSTWESQ